VFHGLGKRRSIPLVGLSEVIGCAAQTTLWTTVAAELESVRDYSLTLVL
jgi:hypothetical protein